MAGGFDLQNNKIWEKDASFQEKEVQVKEAHPTWTYIKAWELMHSAICNQIFSQIFSLVTIGMCNNKR